MNTGEYRYIQVNIGEYRDVNENKHIHVSLITSFIVGLSSRNEITNVVVKTAHEIIKSFYVCS